MLRRRAEGGGSAGYFQTTPMLVRPPSGTRTSWPTFRTSFRAAGTEYE